MVFRLWYAKSLVNSGDSLTPAKIQTGLIVVKQDLPCDVLLPNDETKAAMLDVRAKNNLETLSLEQLQRDIATKSSAVTHAVRPSCKG